MATPEEENLAQFRRLCDTATPGIEGVKHDGALYRQAKWANESATAAKAASEGLNSRLHPGTTGVRFEGDLYGILRRTEYNTAVTTQLVSALKAVAGGETFSEEKLLAGIADLFKKTVTVDVTLTQPAAQESETAK